MVKRKYDFEVFIAKILRLSETNGVYCPAYQKGHCRDRNCKLIHIKLSTAVVC